MPSCWSKRYESTELLEKYFKLAEDTTKEVRNSTEHELNISYGSSERTKYDIYGTNLPKNAPIFLFIHGGYWKEFSKDLSGLVVPNLIAHGIKVVVGGYDLCPNVRLTEIINQIKLLTEKILTMARLSGSQCVWIGGHSAGAHLAAALIHDQNWLDLIASHGLLTLLKGLVLIGGIYAIEPLLGTSLKDCLNLSPDEIKSYTFAPFNESDVTEDNFIALRDLKVIVTVGECDSPIFIEESRRYSRRLIKLVDNVEFLFLRGIDHFDIIENLTNKEYHLSKVLIKNLTTRN
ncbi:PREDICTED: kynurenine formamidase [Ceratosolen solmsi marchali]|uniref:Kynurenine formamidase n=1 Tax=Ceratosolen solmsi marchali TaxID=326594 RepID=A0AAJ7DXU2_9HYME|nr:PREDICTED: kynurenine formamidase [Ceratosolen solmsi marchali]